MKVHFHKHIRNSIFVLMLGVVAWCTAGHLVWGAVRHIHYAIAMERLVHITQTCDTVSLSATDLYNNADIVWMDEKEIRYKGRMFDISRQVIINGGILLIGRYDEWDDELLTVLEKLFTGQAGHTAGTNNLLWMPEATLPEAMCLPSVLLADYPCYILLLKEPCKPLYTPAVPPLPPSLFYYI